jgi:hypothetical protein
MSALVAPPEVLGDRLLPGFATPLATRPDRRSAAPMIFFPAPFRKIPVRRPLSNQ